jgi:molybdopterin synthase sulfur carrier subunit
MVNVRVRGFAVFRDILGPEELEISTKAKTIDQLIAHLTRSISAKLKDVLLDSATGEAQRGNKILVNGRDVEFLQGLATRLKDGDHVVFFPPVGGG